MIDREKALELVKNNIKSENLIKHCLAVETVMRELACYFNEDEEKWAITGLLHDIDYEETKDNPEQHSLVGGEMLKKYDLDQDMIEAIKAHNEIHGLPRNNKITKALFCADPITGLIVASTLVLPSKKLADLRVGNISNRYQEKSFAKGANRETIATCQELELSLEEFFKLSLRAMQDISDDLGL